MGIYQRFKNARAAFLNVNAAEARTPHEEKRSIVAANTDDVLEMSCVILRNCYFCL